VPFIFIILCSGCVALLRGGRLSNLNHFSIRWSVLPLLALSIQILVIYGPGRNDAGRFSLSAVLILGSYALLMIAVWVNRHVPGMAWLGLGAGLNVLVILVNGGWMPITAQSLQAVGVIGAPADVALGQRVQATKDVVMSSAEIQLRWLSDLFVIPNAGIFTMVFSAGDALMMLGLFQLIQVGMVSRAEGGFQKTDQIVRQSK
jgi:hypothetical protein